MVTLYQIQMEALITFLAIKEADLRDLEKEEDTTSEEEKINRKVKKLGLDRAKAALQLRDVMRNRTEASMEQDSITVAKLEAASKLQTLKSQSDMFDHEFEQLRTKKEEGI